MQYFKHMSNMRNDVRIRRLINKYGIEGYGLYNLILESITESLTSQSPLPDLQETSEDIADFYKADTAKINEIMLYMVNGQLFEVDNISGNILCAKIYKFLEANQTRSEEIRRMISSYKKQRKLLLSQTVSDKSEEEKRIEESRKEKIKSVPVSPKKPKKPKPKKIEYAEYVTMTEVEHSKLIEKYGEKQTGKMIEKLSTYKGSTGKAYKSDYLTMFSWVADAVKAVEVGAKQTRAGWTCKCGYLNEHTGSMCSKCKEFRE